MSLLDRSKEDIQQQLEQDFYAEYPDINQNIGNPITHLIRVFSGVAETLNYYADRTLQESAISTATRDISIRALVSGINYRPSRQTESIGQVTFTLSEFISSNVIIPAGTIVLGNYQNTDIQFRTLIDAIIITGSTFIAVDVQQGQQTLIDEFTGVGGRYQRFLLTNDTFNEDSLVVTVDGIEWLFKESLINSSGTDLHFTTFVSHEGTYILFGDSTYGATIPANSEIKVLGRSGGGLISNVPISTINTIVSTISVTGADLSVSNSSIFQGGEDAETIEQTTFLAPQSLSSLNRAVSTEDYKIVISRFPGVGRGFAWGERDEPVFTVDNFNRARFTFITNEQTVPSAPLVQDVTDELSTKKQIEVFLEYVVPVIVNLNVVFDVKIFPTNNPTIVEANINTALNDLYSVTNQNFGTTIHYSDVLRTITNVAGVDYVLNLTLNTGTTNIDLDNNEFPKINTVGVTIL